MRGGKTTIWSCAISVTYFPWEVTKIAYQKDKYLRQFQRRFVDLFQAFIGRQQIQSGMRSV